MNRASATACWSGPVLAALLLGATTAFVELQNDLDTIWRAEPRTGSGREFA